MWYTFARASDPELRRKSGTLNQECEKECVPNLPCLLSGCLLNILMERESLQKERRFECVIEPHALQCSQYMVYKKKDMKNVFFFVLFFFFNRELFGYRIGFSLIGNYSLLTRNFMSACSMKYEVWGQALTDILRATRCGGPRRGKLRIKVSAKSQNIINIKLIFSVKNNTRVNAESKPSALYCFILYCKEWKGQQEVPVLTVTKILESYSKPRFKTIRNLR